MVVSSPPGHKLIVETPLSLLALTRHHVEAHEENWFARCRADYLRAFPLSLLETVRLALLLLLVGPRTNPVFTLLTMLGWCAVMAMQRSVRHKEARREFDEKRALKYRVSVIRLRAAWWACALLAALLIAPEASMDGLIALGVAMMVIDGISAMSVPHLGLAASASGAAAVSVGLLSRTGWDGAAVAVTVWVMTCFMHWSLYNLYYMFATRRIRTRRLSQSNETIQLLLNQYDDEGSDWLYEIGSKFQIWHPSQRFADACGRKPEELEGLSLIELLGDVPEAADLRALFDEGRAFRNVVVPIRVDGVEHWWSLNGRPILREGQTIGWRGFIADITVAKRAEAKVAFMAHYDVLTQLPNRTLFNATLDRAFHRTALDGSIGLLYVDLDHFKAINDGHGHAVGDKVLVEISRRLEEVVRPRDMIARLGGDEFVILMTDLDSPAAGLAIAERVLGAVGNAIEIDGQIMPIGASIGAAFAPTDGQTGDELLRAADLAMYNAKSRGRRGISVFDPDMQVQMQERRALELDLRAAIVRGELELHYQPLLDINRGVTAGYEALLRWNHATRGTVSPDVFIPIAEETGVIVEIGEWVIRTALAEAAGWPEDLTVAVNMSPAQMKDGNLLSVVVSALAQSGVTPNRLELEITENLLMQESEEVLATLHKIRALGVKIALDDFGTGYSSLNYLRSFPFDKIKIDRCFVSELAEREDCQAIVRSVISLANELKMTTTAEGVEFGEQLEKLRKDGCDQAQGFLYSRAVPAGELEFKPGQKRAVNE
ncbi:putative bifunctional diguanylate cyclase/phosphodiesterase [Novosphingobium sp. JCM 18896]|uniref:putative bifunctional diguanylate cyclase/phosphodiesterase n=1 Tax=Novosphingobium sp. JCM 18896 TaxID=2989731 RepID=UPI002223BD93|nr:EAL domain-containing protein [Novosphingobium sp. JCM 18896]MCW1427880.1 EAL domain-containing protein [Novosphingobium sp. JCM 18896]